MRKYTFDWIEEFYEDDLPDDMTDADYRVWLEMSYVDGVRLGPRPVPLIRFAID